MSGSSFNITWHLAYPHRVRTQYIYIYTIYNLLSIYGQIVALKLDSHSALGSRPLYAFNNKENNCVRACGSVTERVNSTLLSPASRDEKMNDDCATTWRRWEFPDVNFFFLLLVTGANYFCLHAMCLYHQTRSLRRYYLYGVFVFLNDIFTGLVFF